MNAEDRTTVVAVRYAAPLHSEVYHRVFFAINERGEAIERPRWTVEQCNLDDAEEIDWYEVRPLGYEPCGHCIGVEFPQ